MAFSKFQLTTAGTEILNRVLAENKTLTFTKFEIGDGNYTGDVKQLTSLVSKFKELNVLDTNIVNSQVNIRSFLDNSDLEEEKYLREIGVFARIGDEVLTEVLFSYSNSGDTAELIPDKSEYFSRTLSIYSFIGDVQSVNFSVDLKIEKTDFNTKEELRITNLEIGSKVNLWGSNELGDTYKTSYIITSEVTNFQLANGLYAKLYSQPLEMGNIPQTIISAETILELLKNNGGLQYDEDNLYINNDLLKKKNHYYIDTEQVGLWKCLEDTNVNYNSSTYFVNRSNEENASKLENLGINATTLWQGQESSAKDLFLSESYKNFDFLIFEGLSTGIPNTAQNSYVQTLLNINQLITLSVDVDSFVLLTVKSDMILSLYTSLNASITKISGINFKSKI